MAITNSEIATIFKKVADLLEIKGENPFKVRAYRNASRTIENIAKPLSDLVKKGYDLTKLPGIGPDLSKHIKEIVKTGEYSKLKNLEKEIPSHLIDMLAIEGLGPKRVRIIYENLDIKSLDDLKRAAESGKLEKLPGFGPTLIKKILKGIKLAKKAGERFRYDIAQIYAEDIIKYLQNQDNENIIDIVVAGSFRRKKETVGDLDILVTAKNIKKVIDHFVNYNGIKEVVTKGTTRSTVILKSNLQIDLRSVPKESYGAALHYFTGSKSHNIAIRKIALKLGLKINEYGVFKDEKKIAGKSEEEVYRSVGLCYIEPELRENRGEIEAAKNNKLPNLIELSDIKGDLHIHTKYSDGKNSIEEIAKVAIKKGYEYIAITDHSKRVTVANGLDEKRVFEQIEEIDRVSEKLNIAILKGIEVDILADGSLDLSDDVLKELDIVVGAIHYGFNFSKELQTYRVLKAMDNLYFNILAHPTGRIIGKRKEYDIDLEKIMEHAKDNGCFLEINSQPERLDLNDIDIKLAKDIGVKMGIFTDSHNIFCLDFMNYGINQARRGWCTKDEIINTSSLDELKKLLNRRRP